jgi:hypothetical protein
MKKVLIAFSAVVFAAGIANAQDATQTAPGAQTTAPVSKEQVAKDRVQKETASPQERAQKSAMRWKETLKLSEEQTAKVEGVIQSRIEAVEKVKADASMSEDAKKAAIEKIRAEKEAELKAILTPDQQKVFDAKKDEMEKRPEESKK